LGPCGISYAKSARLAPYSGFYQLIPPRSDSATEKLLATMKPSAMVINLDPSSLVDHLMLMSDFQAGRLADGALDVFE
jgi:hypothetical protein